MRWSLWAQRKLRQTLTQWQFFLWIFLKSEGSSTKVWRIFFTSERAQIAGNKIRNFWGFAHADGVLNNYVVTLFELWRGRFKLNWAEINLPRACIRMRRISKRTTVSAQSMQVWHNLHLNNSCRTCVLIQFQFFYIRRISSDGHNRECFKGTEKSIPLLVIFIFL